MSYSKPKKSIREMVALEALRRDLALVKKGRRVYAFRKDGTKELLSESSDNSSVWDDALSALGAKDGSIGEASDSPISENDVYNTAKLVIYSDGGSRGNPGPSASGYVILTNDESHVLEAGGKYLGVTTNNQAEYQAVKLALEAAKKFNPEEIDFYVDSLLVANQLNGVFKVKNKELGPVHEAIKKLASDFHKVTFKHVYREENELADEQVNKILDEEKGLQKS